MKKTYIEPVLRVVPLCSTATVLATSNYQVNTFSEGETSTVGDDED